MSPKNVCGSMQHVQKTETSFKNHTSAADNALMNVYYLAVTCLRLTVSLCRLCLCVVDEDKVPLMNLHKYK